jgi:hypothetical protein
MGFGKSSSSSTPEITPEQRQLLAAQTGFLTGTAFPAYQKTVGMAKDVYGQVSPAATTAAQTAMDVSGRAGALQEAGGVRSYLTGMQGLEKLFSPEYKQEQIDASLQPAREEIREQIGSQNAMFGGAGGAGSTRALLARENLKQLGEQRMGSVVAQTSAGIEQRRQQAAESLLGAGERGLTGAQQSAASRINYAQTPQDVLSKYASIIYGTPQGSTTPNFQGTQGQTSSGKGFGIKI